MSLLIPQGHFVIKEGSFFEAFKAKNEHKSSLIKQIVTYNLTTLGQMPKVLIGYQLEITNPEAINEEQYRLSAKIEVVFKGSTASSVPSWANFESEDYLEDPITFEKIKKSWIESPRFIKLAPYVLNINSVLNVIFRHPLDEGRIKHPVETRYMTKEETAVVLDHLSHLFKIDQSQIMKCFSPFVFQTDWELINKRCTLEIEGWHVMNSSKHEEIINEIFLNAILDKNVESYRGGSLLVKEVIKHNVRQELFFSLRLYNFFLNVDDDVLKTPVYTTEADFYNLLDLQTKVIENLMKFGTIS